MNLLYSILQSQGDKVKKKEVKQKHVEVSTTVLQTQNSSNVTKKRPHLFYHPLLLQVFFCLFFLGMVKKYNVTKTKG